MAMISEVKIKSKDKNKKNRNSGITRISLFGYKSFLKEVSIDVKPLTILSGTNSSGKSSIMQPLLLMKQTLEESFNPGSLLLNGPNVKFTSVDQILSKENNIRKNSFFTVGIEINNNSLNTITFSDKKNNTGFQVTEMRIQNGETIEKFNPNMSAKELEINAPATIKLYKDNYDSFFNHFENCEFKIYQDRFLMKICLIDGDTTFFMNSVSNFENKLFDILHLPGLRGNPERNYPITAAIESKVNTKLPGTFEKYVASIISQWQNNKNASKLRELENSLKILKLTDRVKTEQINDTEVRIFVGRSNNGNQDDFVSIADVGLGVSQTLPILVALTYASPGQIVYIEQPEIHLHPKAQYNLAILLAKAAKRGVKVIVETHSSLLIRGIQTQIANETISHELIALHWFSRANDTGETLVTTAELDEFGTFGDWPEDFDNVSLDADMEYLNAVEKRSFNV
jgi:predicted ATPase